MNPPRARLRVLFVCVENSCRSQMAEAFARMDAGDVLEPHSAGSRPSGRVHPGAIESMSEVGCDLSGHRSKSLEEVPQIEWDLLVTMGCGDACPWVQARKRADWAIPDPKHLDAQGFGRVRDQIRERVRALADD